MNNGPKQNPFCLLGDQSWGQVHFPEALTQTVFPRAFKRPWPGAEEGGFGGFRTDLVFSETHSKARTLRACESDTMGL